nr:hypothetical protein [Pedobacter sp. ASV19]
MKKYLLLLATLLLYQSCKKSTNTTPEILITCLLYTSDAADER